MLLEDDGSTVEARDGVGFLADCDARLVAEIFANKWAIVVLFALLSGPKRPVELVAISGGVSRKVLTETLRRLEDYGLLTRQSHDAPRRVEYSLTALGRTLQSPIDALTRWARAHGGAVSDARDGVRPE